jgi:hypothetical protein
MPEISLKNSEKRIFISYLQKRLQKKCFVSLLLKITTQKPGNASDVDVFGVSWKVIWFFLVKYLPEFAKVNDLLSEK